jgi:hypothetical protein
MITFSAIHPDPTFEQWKVIDRIVRRYMMDNKAWRVGGYEGMSREVKKKFNFTITRVPPYNSVQFTFDTEEDYTMFLLKYTR